MPNWPWPRISLDPELVVAVLAGRALGEPAVAGDQRDRGARERMIVLVRDVAGDPESSS